MTFAAGVVDAVSFLGLGEIFTANMTGNTIFLAIAVGQGELLTALHSVDALIGFSAGAFLAGRFLRPGGTSVPWPVAIRSVVWGQLAFVTAFAVGWAVAGGRPVGGLLYVLILLLSFGMGLQSAAARAAHVAGVTTTTITTALVGLMAELAVLGSDERRWAATILALFAGGALGAGLLLSARAFVPFVAVATIALVGAMATVGPWVRRPSASAGGATT